MRSLYLLCIILSISLVKGNDPKVLNIALPNRNIFFIQEHPNENYTHVQFDPQSDCRVTTVYDSGADIWKSDGSDNTFLLRADVFFKKRVAQLVKLNIYMERIDITKYYVRERGGKFVEKHEEMFNACTQADMYFCGDLVLEFKRGFSFNFFKKEKIIVFGKKFVKFVTAEGVDIARLTNGREIILDNILDQYFSYVIYFHVEGVNEMIKIVVNGLDGHYTYHYYEFYDQAWNRSTASRLEELYKSPETTHEHKVEGKWEEADETIPRPDLTESLALPHSGEDTGDLGSGKLTIPKDPHIKHHLVLGSPYDTELFDVSDHPTDGLVTFKVIIPEFKHLTKVSCNGFDWVIDPYTEISYDMVTAYFYKNTFHLIKFDVTKIDKILEVDYITVFDGKYVSKSKYLECLERLIEADSESLSDQMFLSKSPTTDVSTHPDSSERLIEFDLDAVKVESLYIRKFSEEGQNPYWRYRTKDGYYINKITLKGKEVWRAYLPNERATKGTLYFLNDEPGYLNLTIPELPRPNNNITIDLVSGRKIPNFSIEVLKRVFMAFDPEISLSFNLTDPIDYTVFKIDKKQHRDFVCRDFRIVGRIISSVFHHKDQVTPRNMIPFTDLQVYYYQRSPILFIADHILYPQVFMNAASGWRTSNVSSLESDLDDIKSYLDGPHLGTSRSLYLSYEDYLPTSFEVEVRKKNQITSKTFLPTLKSLITLISCNKATVYGSSSSISSGVRFYIKDDMPYKAEVHRVVGEGVSKLIFKVFDETNGIPSWKDIDEDDFNKI
uniref:SfiI-subtelomeric related protein family member n=1 Tax=Theileria annulata TaxID=5874 RepID=A0A3B0NFR4_THEAN